MGDCSHRLGCRRSGVVQLSCGCSRALQHVPLLQHAVKETLGDHLVLYALKLQYTPEPRYRMPNKGNAISLVLSKAGNPEGYSLFIERNARIIDHVDVSLSF